MEEEQLQLEDLDLDPRLLHAIAGRGLSKPTPLQLKAIPFILEGRDVVAQVAAGSGKTLAYLLPLIQKCLHTAAPDHTFPPSPAAIVFLPTRRHCQQAYSLLLYLLEYCGSAWRTAQLTSAMSPSTLKTTLNGHPHIIVCTPACLTMCFSERILKASILCECLSTLVLDEADLLLSYGYEEDLRNLAPHVPRKCQCVLMSSTLSADLDKLKKLLMHSPVTLTLMDIEESQSEAL